MWRNKTEFDGVTSIVMDQSGIVLQHDFKTVFWMTVLGLYMGSLARDIFT